MILICKLKLNSWGLYLLMSIFILGTSPTVQLLHFLTYDSLNIMCIGSLKEVWEVKKTKHCNYLYLHIRPYIYLLQISMLCGAKVDVWELCMRNCSWFMSLACLGQFPFYFLFFIVSNHNLSGWRGGLTRGNHWCRFEPPSSIFGASFTCPRPKFGVRY